MGDDRDQIVRPTVRCLTEDIGLQLPLVTVPLHGLDLPIIKRAQQIPAKQRENGAERILSLKDRVWLKAKTSRERGAVTEHPHVGERPGTPECNWWLGAVGFREEGSGDDAYADLKARSTVAKDKSPSGINTTWMLPTATDALRHLAEFAAAQEEAMYKQICALIAESARSGKTLKTVYGRHSIEVRVRVHDHETYLAVGATGVADYREVAALLSSVPGMTPDDWLPEPGEVLGIEPHPGQIVFSAILLPAALAEILDQNPPGALDVRDET